MRPQVAVKAHVDAVGWIIDSILLIVRGVATFVLLADSGTIL